MDKRYSQKTEPGPWATKNKRVSPGEENQGQISEMRQGASDLNDQKDFRTAVGQGPPRVSYFASDRDDCITEKSWNFN